MHYACVINPGLTHTIYPINSLLSPLNSSYQIIFSFFISSFIILFIHSFFYTRNTCRLVSRVQITYYLERFECISLYIKMKFTNYTIIAIRLMIIITITNYFQYGQMLSKSDSYDTSCTHLLCKCTMYWDSNSDSNNDH